MPVRVTVCAGASSLSVSALSGSSVGASLTASTVTVKVRLTVLLAPWPSLTVTVIVAVPIEQVRLARVLEAHDLRAADRAPVGVDHRSADRRGRPRFARHDDLELARTGAHALALEDLHEPLVLELLRRGPGIEPFRRTLRTGDDGRFVVEGCRDVDYVLRVLENQGGAAF